MTLEETALAVSSDGIRLAGGVCAAPDAKGAVVLLHGIPSAAPPDPGDEGYPGLARRFAEHGWFAAWVEMRGVRKSEGFFSIEGWVADARAIVDEVRGRGAAARGPLAIVGSSAGGAVAVEAVKRGATVDALALLAAPAAWMSFADDAQAAVTRVTGEAGLSLSEVTLDDPAPWAAEFEGVVPESAIGSVEVPVLVVHGTDDDVVPVDHAQRIARRAPRAELRVIEGAVHQLRRDERAVQIVLDWLDRTLR
jgi:alpha-beta hydrolase superfamily lysophospholipase